MPVFENNEALVLRLYSAIRSLMVGVLKHAKWDRLSAAFVTHYCDRHVWEIAFGAAASRFRFRAVTISRRAWRASCTSCVSGIA